MTIDLEALAAAQAVVKSISEDAEVLAALDTLREELEEARSLMRPFGLFYEALDPKKAKPGKEVYATTAGTSITYGDLRRVHKWLWGGFSSVEMTRIANNALDFYLNRGKPFVKKEEPSA